VFFHRHRKVTNIVDVNIKLSTFVRWMAVEALQEQIHLTCDTMAVQTDPPLILQKTT
jgi:hypothetical protein